MGDRNRRQEVYASDNGQHRIPRRAKEQPATLRIMSLTLTINGQKREFPGLASPVTLAKVIAEINLKGDRIAVEHNGEIAQRTRWEEVSLASGDRLEVVHFVGGGM